MEETKPHPVHDERTPQIRHGRASSATLVPEMLAAFKEGKIQDTTLEHIQETNEEDISPNDKYLSGRPLVFLTIGFLLADFVASLDQSMVATALPKMASQFHALDQLTWIVSAFFLTEAGAMLTLGQIMTVAPSKWVFTGCFILFKAASLICALAPKIEVLIFGRGLQGIAVSGGLLSVVTMISQVARVEVRATIFGTFAMVAAVSSVAGPLLGGLFTDRYSWRWCFWINLPISATSLLAVLIWMPVHPPLPSKSLLGLSTARRWLALDWIGALLSLAVTTSFILPLQWGGILHPWNATVIIVLFCVSAALLVVFVLWQLHQGERALVPLHLLKRRTQLAGGISSFFLMMSFLISIYYLPYFYQAKGASASRAGVNILPYMMAMVAGILTGGYAAGATGRYWHSLIVGPLISAIGAGLLFTINDQTPNAHVIGFQILLGFGIGVAYQMPLVSLQGEYANEPELTPQAMSLLLFFQLLGGMCGIAISGAIFGNRLRYVLNDHGSMITPEILKEVTQSVTVIFQLPEPIQNIVVTAYVNSLRYAFIVIVPACAMASFFGLFVKNRNLKGDLNASREDLSTSTDEEKGSGQRSVTPTPPTTISPSRAVSPTQTVTPSRAVSPSQTITPSRAVSPSQTITASRAATPSKPRLSDVFFGDME